MSHATTLEGSGDPRAVHAAITECVESYLFALDMIRPTPSNDCGDPGTANALVTLTRLGEALKPFPRRRIDPDPFALTGELITLPVGRSRTPVRGSSLHDVWLRIVGRAYDAMRIVPTYIFTDPSTGESFEGAKSTRGSEFADDNGGRIVCIGPPDHFHFTDLSWDDDLWRKVIIVIIDQSIDFYGGLAPAPYRTLDQIQPILNAEFSFALRHAPLALAGEEDKPAPALKSQQGKPDKKTKGKNVNGRMMDVISTNVESHGWSAMQWAQHLKCSDGTVKATNCWNNLLKSTRALTAATQAERMEGSRTHKKGQKKPRHESRC